MSPRLKLVLIVAMAALGAAGPAVRTTAQDYPEPVGYVNDFANVIDADIEAGLEDALRLTEEETTIELVVVTVPDMGGSEINEYAVALFEEWQIGKEGEDNGILFITAVGERETKIELGYGIEPFITDSKAGRILDGSVLPAFAEDDFTSGILEGALALRLAIDESGYAPGAEPPGKVDLGVLQPLADRIWLLIVIGVVSMYVLGVMSRTKSVWLGAFWGSAVGGLGGWIIGGWAGLAIGIAGIGLAGLMLDAMLSTAYRHTSSSGGSTALHRSWGGFGGLGGGMRSGGGFGGFGGGRSGGGGARRGF